MHSLHSLFNPESVAIIGASSDPERIGGRPLRFMLESGFGGALYPVNISGKPIQGLTSYASVTDIPGPVDQAIIAVPAPGVEAALLACAEKGVKSVQIFTAGFAELGDEGRARQARLVEICSQRGIRMIGPNSLGLLNVSTGYFATFSTALNGLSPKPGVVGLATQSGAFGSAAYGMATLRGLGLSKIVATGNEADIDVAECIDYLAEDAQTRVICAALESCRDGERLRAALLKAAHAGKPVVIMKVGRTELGAAAASTHTGSLAGNDTVYDTVFAECGAYRAQSIEEMLDIAYLCSVTGQLPANAEIGIVTGSGGIGILMADHAGEQGLDLPPLPPAGIAAALELLPFAVAANPLDMTAQVTSVKNGVSRTIDTMLRHAPYGTVFAYLAHVGLSPVRFAETGQQIIALRQAYPDRLLIMVMLSEAGVTRHLEDNGIPVFGDPSRAVHAVAAAAKIVRLRRHLFAPHAIVRSSQLLGDVSGEAAAKKVLGDAGLPMLPEKLCASADAAADAASSMGFPVVAKIASADILHKTEIGGVMLNLRDAGAVRGAFTELMRRAESAAPLARLDGVLVAPMVRDGVETIIGIHMDPTFGPMVMFGSGGTAVELFKDVAFASAPLTPQRAQLLIESVRSSQLLRGWRGGPDYDEAALRDALCRVSEFAVAHAHELDSIDINPFVVRESGAICLDAVIALRDPGTKAAHT